MCHPSCIHCMRFGPSPEEQRRQEDERYARTRDEILAWVRSDLGQEDVRKALARANLRVR